MLVILKTNMVEDPSITIRILRKLVYDVEEFLKTPQGRRWKNRVDFIETAIRDKLDEYKPKRFELINHHENIIRVLDNQIGEHGDIVELRIKNGRIYCSECEVKDYCLHIKFAWSDPELAAELKKAGLRSPF
jgi:metal-responsive CopG/Arc/MetJ family transcriptional regulator